MANLGDLFGKDSVAGQFLLWQIMGQLIAPILAPYQQSIANEVWQIDTAVPTPADVVANLVARNKMTEGDGETILNRLGMNGDVLAHMVAEIVHAVPLEGLLALWNRGKGGDGPGGISDGDLIKGLQDLGIDPGYEDMARLLAVSPPTTQEALNALLQGQISRDEAQSRWIQAGGDPTWFDDAFNSEGSSPTPDMLGTMANRGIIPWDGGGPDVTSFHQGFLEGPWRDKWETPMRALAEYLPPPRTVTALEHSGVLTSAQALALYEKEGLSPELAAAYVKSATEAKTVADKTLAKGDVLNLYKARLITKAQATSLLTTLKYNSTDAAYVLALADFNVQTAHTRSAVNRVHGLYTTHKITKDAAVSALHSIGVSPEISSETIAAWDIETAVNVKQLTEPQIVSAWYDKIMTEGEAMTELQHLGYTAYDAWVLLSIKNKGPLGGKPGATAGFGGVNP